MATIKTAPNGAAPSSERTPEKQSSVLDELRSLAGRIQDEIKTKQRHRENLIRAHRLRLAEVDGEIARYRRVLKALGVEEPKKLASTATKARATVSASAALEGAEACLQEEGLFTALELKRKNNKSWSEPHLYTLLGYLRSIEFIGKAGKDPATKRDLYRVMDRDKIKQLRQQVKEPVNA